MHAPYVRSLFLTKYRFFIIVLLSQEEVPMIRGLLHDHIDGSAVLTELIHDFYRLAGVEFPFSSVKEWLLFFQKPQENIIKISIDTKPKNLAEELLMIK